MKKNFSELTPKELLEVKEDCLWRKDITADWSRAAEEISDEEAEKLYNDPEYATRNELFKADLILDKEYPWKKRKGTFVGKFFPNSDGTRTFKFIPEKKE